MPPSVIAELRAEIAALWAKVQAPCSLHKASTVPPLSPCTNPTVMPPHPPSPSAALSISMVQEGVAHPNHRWLQAVINNQYCPPTFHHINSSMVPSYPLSILEDVQQVLQVIYEADIQFVGFNSNGDLCVAIQSYL